MGFTATLFLGAGCVGAKTIASDGRPCGMLLQSRLSKPMEEATLTYRMKFSEGFDWTAGGKLPGLSAEGAAIPTLSPMSLDSVQWTHLCNHICIF